MKRSTAILLGGAALAVGALVVWAATTDDGLPQELWYPVWRDADSRKLPEARDAAGGQPIPGIVWAGGMWSPAGDCTLVFVEGGRRNLVRDWRMQKEFGDELDPMWGASAFYVPTTETAQEGAPQRPDGRVWRKFERFGGPLTTDPALGYHAEQEAKRRHASMPAPPRDR